MKFLSTIVYASCIMLGLTYVINAQTPAPAPLSVAGNNNGGIFGGSNGGNWNNNNYNNGVGNSNNWNNNGVGNGGNWNNWNNWNNNGENPSGNGYQGCPNGNCNNGYGSGYNNWNNYWNNNNNVGGYYGNRYNNGNGYNNNNNNGFGNNNNYNNNNNNGFGNNNNAPFGNNNGFNNNPNNNNGPLGFGNDNNHDDVLGGIDNKVNNFGAGLDNLNCRLNALSRNLILSVAFFNISANITYNQDSNHFNQYLQLPLRPQFVFGSNVDCRNSPVFVLTPGVWRLTLGLSAVFRQSNDYIELSWYTVDYDGYKRTQLGVVAKVIPTTFSARNEAFNPISEAIVFVRPGTYLKVAPFFIYRTSARYSINDVGTSDVNAQLLSENNNMNTQNMNIDSYGYRQGYSIDTRGTYGVIQQIVDLNNYGQNCNNFGFNNNNNNNNNNGNFGFGNNNNNNYGNGNNWNDNGFGGNYNW